MATHSSILACRIPWTEEPGGPKSMGLQRVRLDWATNTDSSPFLDSQWDSGYDWNSYNLATLYLKKWKGFCRYNQIPNQFEFFNREIIFGRFDLIRWAFKKVGFFLKTGVRRMRESCGISVCGGSHVAGTWKQHLRTMRGPQSIASKKTESCVLQLQRTKFCQQSEWCWKQMSSRVSFYMKMQPTDTLILALMRPLWASG